MKKKIIGAAFVLVCSIAIGWNLQDNRSLTDISLDNVEALAGPEVGIDWYCVGSVNDCYWDNQGSITGKRGNFW